MLSEKPQISITASVATSDTGIAIVGMIVVRQLCRKTNTTSDDERSAPRPSVITTSCIEADTKRVVS